MLWKGRRQSDNIEDRRGVRPAGLAMGGGITTLIIAVVVMLLGGDPRALLEAGGGSVGGGGSQQQAIDPSQQEAKEMVAVVLADTEDVWNEQFAKMGRKYQEPTLVLFSGAVESACGLADSAVGPFYCPGDGKVYLDLSFFDELGKKFGAPGDFAQAYVVAHEVGHHVQNLLGISEQVERARRTASKADINRLSVRMELQADFFAGVWAHHTQTQKKVLDRQDLEEALNAANAIGDDRLQRQAQGTVVPDSFTHGTSEQRMRWFKKGFETGDVRQGDTFKATRL